MINKINGISFKNNFNQAKKKNSYTAGVSKPNYTKISFGNQPNKINNILYQNIIQKGYALFKNVDLISPGGFTIKGHAFIKSSPEASLGRDLTSIITDQDFYELGVVSAHNNYNERGKMQKNVLICSVINFTDRNVPLNFSRTPDFPIRHPQDGKYQYVGKQAYKSLEEYILKKCPEVDTLLAAPITSDSWNFHVRIGFDGKIGDYDSYSIINYIEKKIRK